MKATLEEESEDLVFEIESNAEIVGEEMEALHDKMAAATADEKAAVKQNAEDLKASMEAVKAAEMGVLQSYEPAFETIGAEMAAAMERKAAELEKL
jgi:hypothetical protein